MRCILDRAQATADAPLLVRVTARPHRSSVRRIDKSYSTSKGLFDDGAQR